MAKKIFIAGSGGIGEAAALLLREWCDFDLELFLGDVNESSLTRAREFVVGGSQKSGNVTTVLMSKDGSNDAMTSAFEQCDVLLDCSPGGQAPRMARFAKDFRMHYANLTEYVAETDEIIRIASDADTGFILQTGLAPGFVNVLAMSLYDRFRAECGVEKVERVAMKVGALTRHAQAPHFYGFTWSPIGVSTEYVKGCRVMRGGIAQELPALSEREEIVVGGRRFEADLTSGGAADLPEFFDGRATNLDYKTIRHLGHFAYADKIIAGIEKNDSLPDRLLERFLKDIPMVEDDFVVVHVSVDGFDQNGVRRLVEKACFVDPMTMNGHHLRAIQTTTAGPLCESAMLLLTNDYKGVVLQSQIDHKRFLEGQFVRNIYGE